jgi:hypothetical protein
VSVVALAGSRSLPAGGAALVSRVAGALVRSSRSLVVGCCAGADAAVLTSSAAIPGCVRCLCAFGPGGVGAGPASAVAAVQFFAAAGGSVYWWAGGSSALPLRVRLAARTRAVVLSASALVVFFGSPSSRGSLLAASVAASCGLPVIAFPLSFPSSALPLLGTGSWAPVDGSGLWADAWRWAAGQGALF